MNPFRSGHPIQFQVVFFISMGLFWSGEKTWYKLHRGFSVKTRFSHEQLIGARKGKNRMQLFHPVSAGRQLSSSCPRCWKIAVCVSAVPGNAGAGSADPFAARRQQVDGSSCGG